MPYSDDFITITLQQDEPLFVFHKIPLREGHQLQVVSETPQHGDLVIIKEEGFAPVVRRNEISNKKQIFWPPLESNPVLIGTIKEVISLNHA